MINTKYVVIIDDDGDVTTVAKKLFKKDSAYQFIQTSSEKKEVRQAMLNVPDLIIINEDNLNGVDVAGILVYIKRLEEQSSITPIILVSSNEDKEHRVDMLKRGIEIYIRKPLNEEYFYYTIKNLSNLIGANRCISALTGLPGNIQIENELKRRMASRGTYAVLYIDLDNFKSYNDKYGFMNGDEVIKYTSDLIQEALQKNGERGDFLGHIGGDDFIAIVNYENARKIGRFITQNFGLGILKYYTEEDIEHGWIKVQNRRGKMEKYPLMTITVAMISNKYKKYTSTLEIGEDGAAIKKKAKTLEGSNFLEDRRTKRTLT